MARKTVKFKNWEIPKVLLHLVALSVVLSWVPFALLAQHRTSLHADPPYHPIQDMDVQPKGKAQAASNVFADGRVMRPRIAGTVARGELWEDDHLYRGYDADGSWTNPGTQAEEPAWITGYPDAITVDLALVKRGQERFDIFCTPCHGPVGRGNGMVHQRAIESGAAPKGWKQPSNIVEFDPVTRVNTFGEELYPNGKMFNTITHGVRSMAGYASQISPEDRWAIVAYIRALQLSQNASIEDVPVADRGVLE